MSRVVAMISGDIQVSNVTTRPGYMTDWKFDEVTSFMSDWATMGLDASQYNSSGSSSMLGGAIQSPEIASKPILHHTL